LASGNWVMPAISDVLLTLVGRCRKFGDVSCTECTGQGNNFELIPTVEMKTRSLTEGYFGSEFPAIYNHCGVMAAWSRKTLKLFEKVLRFLKRPHTVKFSKLCFIATPIDVLCSNCIDYLTKKQNFVWLSSCPYCADRAQNIPWSAPLHRFWDIIAYFPEFKEVTWQWPRPFQGQFVVRRLGLAMINMYTKFEVSSLSCSIYILGGLKV